MKVKQFIIIAALVLTAVVTGKAQGWEYKTIAADEFYNTKADEVVIYRGEDFFAMLSFTNNEFTVKLTDGDKFDKIDVGEMAFVIIGLYDENGQLVKRGEVWAKMNRLRTSFTLVNPTKSGWVKWPSEMIQHLKSGKGSIRIASPTLCRDYFDVTMPCAQKEGK